MEVVSLQCYPTATVSCSMKPKFSKNGFKSLQFSPRSPKYGFAPIRILSPTVPARDQVIDFGRHKGKMLGTLPSSYLKWMSENLRTRDSDYEEWAILAEQVLADPIYGDRIEWEFAERVMSGDVRSTRCYSGSSPASVAEVAERFGWEWGGKADWSGVKKELLGTSRGGRIPRKSDSENEKEVGLKREKKATDVDGGRRAERRERLRMKRGSLRLGATEETAAGLGFGEKFEDEEAGNGAAGKEDGDDQVMCATSEDPTVANRNRFPGREKLFKKVLSSRKRFQ